MFNRALQMRVIKKTEEEEPLTTADKEILYDSVANAVSKVVKKVAMGALAYVIVDTARQVLVARATKN